MRDSQISKEIHLAFGVALPEQYYTLWYMRATIVPLTEPFPMI